jgi:EpsI family protein
MLKRRDLLLGIPLLAAAGAAAALKPRERMNLLGENKLEDMIPLAFASWEVIPSNAVILPEAREGSLADTLYDQTVSRLYVSKTRRPMMLVIAYGNTQSDLLQLHRPEACYTAVGFEISQSRRAEVRVIGDAIIPSRELLATSNDRIEPILYWTRIGDLLPTTGGEQRLMKLQTEMEGFIADGVLVRMSTVGEGAKEEFADLRTFAAEMLLATKLPGRPALVGRPIAQAIKAAA